MPSLPVRCRATALASKQRTFSISLYRPTSCVRSRAKSFAATNAEALAEHHFGDAIYTNMIMLGMAFQNGLIEDGQAWMDMIKARNLTSHTYNQEVAENIEQDTLTQVVEARAKATQVTVDSSIIDDPDAKFVHEITLSYTFHETPLPEVRRWTFAVGSLRDWCVRK